MMMIPDDVETSMRVTIHEERNAFSVLSLSSPPKVKKALAKRSKIMDGPKS